MVRSALLWRAAAVAKPVVITPQKFLRLDRNTLQRARKKVEAGTVVIVRDNPSSGSISAITSDRLVLGQHVSSGDLLGHCMAIYVA